MVQVTQERGDGRASRLYRRFAPDCSVRAADTAGVVVIDDNLPFPASVENVIACFNYLVAIGHSECYDFTLIDGKALCVAGDAQVLAFHGGGA